MFLYLWALFLLLVLNEDIILRHRASVSPHSVCVIQRSRVGQSNDSG